MYLQHRIFQSVVIVCELQFKLLEVHSKCSVILFEIYILICVDNEFLVAETGVV